jgi:hypothetical protein
MTSLVEHQGKFFMSVLDMFGYAGKPALVVGAVTDMGAAVAELAHVDAAQHSFRYLPRVG